MMVHYSMEKSQQFTLAVSPRSHDRGGIESQI
jgi:hypothetical protein